MPALPELVTGTPEPEVPVKFVLEAADIAVVVVYFLFVLAVGIWVSESLQPLWQHNIGIDVENLMRLIFDARDF